MRGLCVWTFCLLLVGSLRADGPQDNLAEKVRPVPPPGVEIPKEDRAELLKATAQLGEEIAKLQKELANKPKLLALLPDVQIYHKAVHDALTYNEFYDVKEVAVAKAHLQRGLARAASLKSGEAPWTTQTGLVPRGYLSKIDGSVQPYGLVVPANFAVRPGDQRPLRLDTWFHGRGEKLTELSFLQQRHASAGEFAHPQALVLHLYGRYCCANKLAGEVDLFEALAHVKQYYPVDEDRICIRGFSMGGAACWHFAVHYPSLWAAAAPGAGFSETPDFLKVFQNEQLKPTPTEQKLWHMYDCTDYAVNLFNLPTVAYSGDKDRQKQAADIMASAMVKEGLKLVHIIGPNTEHKYHPQAKDEINKLIDVHVAKGRDRLPKQVKFTTWTLKYNQSSWVVIDALAEHWARGRVDAEWKEAGTVQVTTSGITGLTLTMPAVLCPFPVGQQVLVVIDGQKVTAPAFSKDKAWSVRLHKGDPKSDKGWEIATSAQPTGLVKKHDLQGPIDDAFLSSFLMVKPTGKPAHEKTGAWAQAELAHSIDHWRKQFRGQVRVKDDTALTEADLAEHNLILWGDPSSNQVLAKLADKLPIRWGKESIQVGKQTYTSDKHVPILIYPNPLNPQKYVVLNSGFTFREYDYLNNARQVPKLPDWAIVDITAGANSRWPGNVVAADFFGEKWELKASK